MDARTAQGAGEWRTAVLGSAQVRRVCQGLIRNGHNLGTVVQSRRVPDPAKSLILKYRGRDSNPHERKPTGF